MHCCKTSKNWSGEPFGYFFRKRSFTMPKKNEWGTFWDFSTTFRSPNKKWRKGPLRKTKEYGNVCYAEKQEKPFRFSSLCEIRVDWKKRVTITVAFHFMKRRLKMGDPEWVGKGLTSSLISKFKDSGSTCSKLHVRRSLFRTNEENKGLPGHRINNRCEMKTP